MSLNRVSFGNVVDIKYRYKAPSAENRVDERAYNDSRDISSELNKRGITLYEARNMLISENHNKYNEDRTITYRKFNRVITGEDCSTYNILHSVNPEFAHKFADGKAQTIIIDV